jgi:DNA-directed RNA polymerase specialized sigma24 family protein
LDKTRAGCRMLSQQEDAQFQHLYSTYRDAIWAYIVRRVDRGDVEDAVAEVFVVAWRRIARAPPGDEALPWLYGISKNVVRNTIRSTRRRQRLWTKSASLAPTERPIL